MHWIIVPIVGAGKKEIYNIGIIPHSHDDSDRKAVQVIWENGSKLDDEYDEADKKVKKKIKPPKAVKSEKKNNPVS